MNQSETDRRGLRIRRCLPTVAVFLAVVSVPSITTRAQSPSAPLPSVAAEDLPRFESDALASGIDLERRGDWSAAATHYQRAMRQVPGSASLYQRMVICRLRADVNRRYQDESYLQSVREMSLSQALDLYGEVLANLETHYVDSIEWSRVMLHGTAALEVALTESAFVDRLLATTDPAAVERFLHEAHHRVADRSTASRFDLRASVTHMANIASKEIGLSPVAVVLEYVSGAVSTLDTYTRLLSPQQLDEMFSNIEGNFVGLGIELKAHADHLQILNVIPGGPAELAGLMTGERIVAVEGQQADQVDSQVVADLLVGPEFSYVEVTIADIRGQTRDLRLQRRRVDVPSVENVHFVDVENRVGYFRLTNFQKTTVSDVEKALWDLHRQGMRSLIIDVRGNPGGLLQAAVEVADHFLQRGAIVTTRGRNVRENYDYMAHRTATWEVPLAVLIDRDSASASEIFAGAMKDSGRALIVGETSYGKGSVQGIFRMRSAQFGLCLTTAKFYSPSGQAISLHGVAPKIAVTPTHIAARPTEDGRMTLDTEDAVLQTAVGQFTRTDIVSTRVP